MPTRTDLEAEIASAQRELQTAQQAERQRVDFETTQQRRIAAAQAQIANLEHQKWLDGVDERAGTYQALTGEAHALYRKIIDALDHGQWDDATNAAKRAKNLFDQASRIVAEVDSIVRAKQDPIWREAYLANGGPAQDYGDGDHVVRARAKQAANSAVAYLDTLFLQKPQTLSETLKAWVASESDGWERQRRRGLCYALTGWFCDGFDAALMAIPHYTP